MNDRYYAAGVARYNLAIGGKDPFNNYSRAAEHLKKVRPERLGEACQEQLEQLKADLRTKIGASFG